MFAVKNACNILRTCFCKIFSVNNIQAITYITIAVNIKDKSYFLRLIPIIRVACIVQIKRIITAHISDCCICRIRKSDCILIVSITQRRCDISNCRFAVFCVSNVIQSCIFICLSIVVIHITAYIYRYLT